TGDANWDVIIHFDPCRPRHCSGCVLESCPVRSEPFAERASFEALDPTREDESLDEGTPLGIDTRINS
ncbi:MAG: hypothetical protein ACKVK6_13630, partial [bacterium]